MSNYTKSTNFATKDTLTSGDPLKIVKGTEIDTEFNNIATAVNSKSDTASPTFTGTVTIPTLALSGLTASSAVATNASNALVSVTNTGTGNNVLATSPTLVTPILGTPQSATLTNATGLPLTTGVTGVLPEANGGTGTTTGFGFKNRLINGAMVIDQRNAGAVVATNGTNLVSLDRWKMGYSQNTKFTVQQTPSATETGYATRVTAGFTNYLAVTSLSAYTVGAAESFTIYEVIEGYNIADFAWGTSGAKTVTLSFWVYSSLTGTFGGCVQNYTQARSYPFSYTISSANTWEQKTITIAGDTTGTWSTTNTGGIILQFGIGVGSTLSGTAGAWAGANYTSATGATSVVGTNGATFYITGVQLEKGSTATSFDYRPYGTELALCQRYYEAASGPVYLTYSNVAGTSTRSSSFFFRTTKRATPTVVLGATSEYIANGSGGVNTTLTPAGVTTDSFYVTGGNFTSGVFAISYTGANNYITMSSEL